MALLKTNIDYAGKDSGLVLVKPMLETNMLEGDHCRLIPDAKSMMSFHTIAKTGNVLQARSCSWTPSNALTLNQVKISVCDFKINEAYCYDELLGTFREYRMKMGAANDTFSDEEIMAVVVDVLTRGIRVDLDQIIWNGDTGSGDSLLALCDGWLKSFRADANVVDVEGTTLTQANIVAEITKVYNAIPEELLALRDDGMRIFISPAAARLYKLATAAATGNNDAGFVGDKQLDFLGLPLVPISTMPTNTMVATHRDNLAIEFDDEADYNALKVIDVSDTIGVDEIRVNGKFKNGVAYAFGSMVVMYEEGLIP